MVLYLESSYARVTAENEIVEHESLAGAWQIIRSYSVVLRVLRIWF